MKTFLGLTSNIGLFAFLFNLVFFFSACEKEEIEACEQDQTGILQFRNDDQLNTLRIVLNHDEDEAINLSPLESETLVLPIGNYQIEVFPTLHQAGNARRYLDREIQIYPCAINYLTY